MLIIEVALSADEPWMRHGRRFRWVRTAHMFLRRNDGNRLYFPQNNLWVRPHFRDQNNTSPKALARIVDEKTGEVHRQFIEGVYMRTHGGRVEYTAGWVP
ncbi:MAG: hypothetical protein ACI9K2_007193 [Myxococcota bacterium]|jgi:hypothetical protein